ncbi:MAG: FliH/SctL family protein [Pseudomonadota bacterium]
MSWQSIDLESFDGVSPAVIDAAAERERARLAAEAAETQRQEAHAEARAAEEAERQRDLVTTLSQLSAEADASRASAHAAVSQLITEAASQLFPALAQTGFTSELAVAIDQIFARNKVAEARLCVSPSDHSRVVTALKTLQSEVEIAVISDPALVDGKAQLAWDAGGAHFDAADMIEAALTTLSRRIEALVGDSDEQR